jgi:hypothetical protein
MSVATTDLWRMSAVDLAEAIGPRYREDLCLDAAAALEDRLGIITPIDPS